MLLALLLLFQGGQATNVRHGSMLPTKCTASAQIFILDAGVLYYCSATDTWSAVGGTVTAASALTANQVLFGDGGQAATTSPFFTFDPSQMVTPTSTMLHVGRTAGGSDAPNGIVSIGAEAGDFAHFPTLFDVSAVTNDAVVDNTVNAARIHARVSDGSMTEFPEMTGLLVENVIDGPTAVATGAKLYMNMSGTVSDVATGLNIHVDPADDTNRAVMLHIDAVTNGDAENVGVEIEDITGATLNYSIKTGVAPSDFGSEIRAGGDVGGAASRTTLTNATNTTLTNAYVVKGGQTIGTTNTGWLKLYVGTTVIWVPYWANATP